MASLRKLLFIMAAVSSLTLFVGTAKSFEFENGDLASEQSLRDLYERWRSYHNVSNHLSQSSLDEKHDRFSVFKENVQHIHASNQMDKPYKLKLNRFADMTNDEFISTYTGAKVVPRRPRFSSSRRASPGPGTFMHETAEKNVPLSIDWRELGAVTGIKNQGLCGSCWAFSTIAAVEGINQIKTKNLISFSEQELVDCDGKNYGCEGGFMELAFEFIKKNGIATEKKYPYLAKAESCNAAAEVADRGVTIDGYVKVPPNENELLKAVARQPVSVSIDAGGKDIQFYSEGVFNGRCGTELNHAVAIVGYGATKDGKKYWTVKNSWGTKWGEQGYIRLERGNRQHIKQGKCGVAMDSTYPILNTTST